MAMLKKVFERPPSTGGELSLSQPLNEAELRQVTEDIGNPGRPIRWGIVLLVLGFFGFVVWAVTAPIDEGVPAPATVTVDTKRKTVQHVSGGIVKEILVREAQHVKAGAVVMRLEDTVPRANYLAAREQYLALRAQEGRLETERKGASQIVFHPDLLGAKNDPVAIDYMSVQRQLFFSRRTALEGQQSILRQTLSAARESLQGLTAQLEAKQAQLKLVTVQLQGTRDLAKEGYLPRNKWFDEERLAADLSGSVGQITSDIAKTRNNIVELELRIAQVKREFLRDVETQLADTARDVEVAAQRLRSTREELERTVIYAPVDGFVVGLAAHTVGGVVAPGARIMDVIPEDVPLTLEARVEPNLVDRVHSGLSTDIRIHAFLDNPNLVVDGRVMSISADLIADQPNTPPYYLARVEVTPEGKKQLGTRQLQPGMPAEVVIKTGERTFLMYLIRPLIRRVSSAFREA